jgi:hypothetical protein
MSSEYLQELNSLRQSVVQRFKQQRISELNELRHRRYLEQVEELTEKIKKAEQTRERRTVYLLKEDLKSLAPVLLPDSSDTISVESIQYRAQNLHGWLSAKEEQLMSEDELEASMLCEVDRLNLLTLLRVFEVKVDFVEDSTGKQVGESQELFTDFQKELSVLADRIRELEAEVVKKVSRTCPPVCLSFLSFDS